MVYLILGAGSMNRFLCFIGHLPRIVFDFLLSLSASAYVIVIFLIKDEITLPFFQQLKYISYAVYIIVPIIMTYIWLQLSQYLAPCAMECKIKEVELASHSFLPNYLGYFFVALSIQDVITLCYVYIVILAFTHLSRALSFNPVFLLFGFQFYFVTGEDGTKIFLITKQRMKPYQDAELGNLHRINDFTFIDIR